SAIEAQAPDVIICDYNLPSFSAERALQILCERGLDVPFIVVSHHIGESAAVVAMQQGASDYLPKKNLERLAKAIDSALDRSRARRERARAQEALRASEALQRGILDSLLSRIALLDSRGVLRAVNRAWEDFERSRVSAGHVALDPGVDYLVALAREEAEESHFAASLAAGIKTVLSGEASVFSMEYEVASPTGLRWYIARAMPLEGGEQGAVVSHRDVTDEMMTHVALQTANRRLQALSQRVLAVQEEERRTIARDLHDDVGQILGALKIGLHRLGQGATNDQELVAECLGAAEKAIEKVRALAMDLRPAQLDQLGLEEALEWLVARQRAVTGLEILCEFTGVAKRFPAALESACFRIAQESLNNATRHAMATRVDMSVAFDGRLLKLVIRDNGRGFDANGERARATRAGSMGLIGMEERAQLAGGRLKLRTVPGAGTSVTATFPLATVMHPADLHFESD
ncbi:MAG TPA: histidine kinase, partial [Usitatibacter sp.]